MRKPEIKYGIVKEVAETGTLYVEECETSLCWAIKKRHKKNLKPGDQVMFVPQSMRRRWSGVRWAETVVLNKRR